MKLKQYIEFKLDEVFIYASYLKLSTGEIDKCIMNQSYKITNPFRVDRNPSFGFKAINTRGKIKIITTDYAKPEFSGDVYQAVGLTLGLNCNNNKDFILICEDIINRLIRNKPTYDKYGNFKLKHKNYEKVAEVVNKKITEITIEYDKWNTNNFMYWYNYVRPNKKLAEIVLKELQQFNIYPIIRYWINNNKRASHSVNKDKPMYAYLLRVTSDYRFYKIYMPNRNPKFVTNDFQKFNYFDMIKPAKYGVLIKSIKDFIFLRAIANYLNIDDVSFIPVNSESVNIEVEDSHRLKQKYEYVFNFYDYDETGFLNAFYNAIMYNIQPIFITNTTFNPGSIRIEEVQRVIDKISAYSNNRCTIESFIEFKNLFKPKKYKTKDFTDFMNEYGVEASIRLFHTYYYSVTEQIEDYEDNYLQ